MHRIRGLPSKVFPIVVISIVVWLQGLVAGQVQALPDPGAIEELDRIGPHANRERAVVYLPNESGASEPYTSSYVRLKTGMNVWSDTAEAYVEAGNEIDLIDGVGVARKAQHSAIFAANVNEPNGAVDVELPDGARFRARPVGLAFTDGNGKSIWLAEVVDTAGVLLPPNEILYSRCFDSFPASVRLIHSTSALEQDVVLEADLPPEQLAAWGLDAASTRLEVWTAVLESPKPVIERGPAGSFHDRRIDLGSMHLGEGRAFKLVDEQAGDQAMLKERLRVSRQWQEVKGQTYIIESIRYSQLQPLLEGLPVHQDARLKPKGDENRAVAQGESRQLPENLVAAAGPAPTGSQDQEQPVAFNIKRLTEEQIAAVSNRREGGLVIDYVILSSGVTDYRFLGTTTYLIDSDITCSGTETVFEPGSVLKFATGTTLTINTPIEWLGEDYLPIVLTAENDASIGEPLGGTLSGYYATIALEINATTAGADADLRNIRVAHAETGISINGRTGHLLRHLQMVNCETGIETSNAEYKLQNALFHQVETNFTGSSSTVRAEQVTVNVADTLNLGGGTSLYLTNSLLVGVSSLGGSYTGNPVSVVSETNSIFKAVGAGHHYLANGSPYRNVGEPDISSDLWADIEDKRTTWAPLHWTDDISSDMIWRPMADRESALPDLGFYYPPLDVVLNDIELTSTLTLTNGFALGIYGRYGIYLKSGSKLISEGTATQMNRIVRFRGIQEQSYDWGGKYRGMQFLRVDGTIYTQPEIRLRFTEWPVMSSYYYERSLLHSYNYLSEFSMTDCQVHNGRYSTSVYGSSYDSSINFTNNLFRHCDINISGEDYYGYGGEIQLQLYNNLFWNGDTTVESYGTSGWNAHDNVFDNTTLSSDSFSNSYNGYVNTSVLSGSSGNDVTVGSFNYASSDLGRFYQSSTSMINQGSRSAGAAGLYQHTVKSNQTKDGGSTVDIGFHYVATDGSEVPLDADSDGLADYREDRDGDGSYSSGDLGNWNSSDSDSDGVDDYTEWLQGRQNDVSTTTDSSNAINLQVYTPLED